MFFIITKRGMNIINIYLSLYVLGFNLSKKSTFSISQKDNLMSYFWTQYELNDYHVTNML